MSESNACRSGGTWHAESQSFAHISVTVLAGATICSSFEGRRLCAPHGE